MRYVLDSDTEAPKLEGGHHVSLFYFYFLPGFLSSFVFGLFCSVLNEGRFYPEPEVLGVERDEAGCGLFDFVPFFF